ncbi:MAG: hypothetical protein OQL16_04850 [Gammaproteobacteria bacterium]|nr:hypothetical protein [Gammaproteobacteria bacterium]
MTVPHIQSVEEFIVHAHALKCESEEQLEMCADSLRAHNNPEAATVFRTLSQMIGETIQELEAMAEGRELPQVPPWDFHWQLVDDPQCMDEVHYLINERKALELAQLNEQRALKYFQDTAEVVTDQAVKELAQRLHDHEQRFFQYIEQRLQQLEEDVAHHDDLDPPNMPE